MKSFKSYISEASSLSVKELVKTANAGPNNGTVRYEIFADKIGLLIARNISNQHKNSKYVVDVKSTGLFMNDEILNKNNCKTIYWKTGHSHIKRKVNNEKALAGFEKSGHFFFNKPIG